MILIIDNFDSFTWNLVDQIRKTGTETLVIRNDEYLAEQVLEMNPAGILISPGPGRPEETGICEKVLLIAKGKIPILGICLGHQLIGLHYHFQLDYADEPTHGKTSVIQHDGKGLFHNLPQNIEVMRYHSLILTKTNQESGLEITAKTSKGEIMGIRDKGQKLEGVQFHPESILSHLGDEMILNWLKSINPEVSPISKM